MAAAAHAAAHLVYSPAQFDGRGLGPLARAVLALLEDARVETLAARELPGLARAWRLRHTATPELGSASESMLERLARALADPAYDDPDPWVQKGRRLFFVDAALGVAALRTPAELRSAATRLGNDLGQMRLPFNAAGYRPAPAYRDDHRWMWAADVAQPEQHAGLQTGGDESMQPHDPTPAAMQHHPEWDRLIARLRPDWVRVIDEPAPARARTTGKAQGPIERRLEHQLREVMTRGDARLVRNDTGDSVDPDALVDVLVGRRARRLPDDRRLWRQRRPHGLARGAVWLLIDQSASTAATPGGSDGTLASSLELAAAVVRALQRTGVAFGAAGFNSNGRHEVRFRTVKELDQPVDGGTMARLHGLRAGVSTRLGAALRHACLRLAAHRHGPLWLLLLSDGQAHDIDVHDPSYLPDDALHAVGAARRRSIRCVCVVPGPVGEGTGDARRIFGPGAVQAVADLQQLPRALHRLMR